MACAINVAPRLARAPVAQLDRALASGAKGYRFDSCRAHHSRDVKHDPTMPTETPERHDARFRPHAADDMAEMFDQVTPHYDLLNTILSLGRDAAWRRAMTEAVPRDAHAVLDLCTGNGISLAGLRRPGRLVIGIDVSLGMLHAAAEAERRTGWAPRLVCADGFRLPLRDR